MQRGLHGYLKLFGREERCVEETNGVGYFGCFVGVLIGNEQVCLATSGSYPALRASKKSNGHV